MASLPELLQQIPPNIDTISEYFGELLSVAVAEVNASFSPKRLSKRPRDVEVLPVDRRQLSSYRTRIGTMLEYAISTEMQRILEERYGDEYLMTFDPVHEYPDFFVRDRKLVPVLRIEMKAVDADSDEQAARFSTPTILLNNDEDLLLIVAWEWTDLAEDGMAVGEYPHIFASLMIPVGAVAYERDKRIEITRGIIDGEKVLVISSKTGEYVPDQGNYGKLWRLVHSSRRHSDDLSEAIRRFMDFLKEVDKRSPRNRLGRR